MKIAHDGEHVVIQIGDELCVLSVREAFAATTELLKAIEGARAHAAYLRGVVPNPTPRRHYRRRPNA